MFIGDEMLKFYLYYLKFRWNAAVRNHAGVKGTLGSPLNTHWLSVFSGDLFCFSQIAGTNFLDDLFPKSQYCDRFKDKWQSQSIETEGKNFCSSFPCSKHREKQMQRHSHLQLPQFPHPWQWYCPQQFEWISLQPYSLHLLHAEHGIILLIRTSNIWFTPFNS